MALETASYIADLVSTNPLTSDAVGQGDDHLRLIKGVLQGTFPNLGNAFARNISCSAGYTVLFSDNTGLVNVPVATGATITHTLSMPALTSVTAGFYLDMHVPGPTDVALIVPTGGASIEGSATFSFGPQSGGRVFYDGAQWRVHQYPISTNGGYAIAGALSVSGAATLGGAVTISGAATLLGTATISGAAHFKTTVSIGGAATLGGAATISGAATLLGTLSVAGAATLGGAATISGAATLLGTLSVAGATTLGGAATISGAATLLGTLSVAGAATFGGTASISGAAHFKTTVSIGGAATLGGAVTISGAATLLSTLDVIGNITTDGYLEGDHVQTAAGDVISVTAWANYDQTGTLTLLDSYNVTSLTDSATGRARINFTTNMANTTYAVSGTVGAASASVVVVQGDAGTGPTDKTVTGVSMDTRASSDALTDFTEVCVTIVGGL